MFLCVTITFEQIPISKSPSPFELFWIHAFNGCKKHVSVQNQNGISYFPIQQSLNHTLLILLSVFEH